MATTRKSTKTTKTDTKVNDGALVVKIILLVGLIIFAGSFGVISYTHGFAVSLAYGQSMIVAILMPAGVDGGLMISAAAMIAARTRATTRAMARLTFTVCLAATLAQNGLYATVSKVDGRYVAHADPNMIAVAWSAIPGVIFVLVIETALRLIRDMTRKTTERDTLGPVAKLMITIKASRARAKRRQRAAQRDRATAVKVIPTEVKAATRYVKAATERAAQTA